MKNMGGHIDGYFLCPHANLGYVEKMVRVNFDDRYNIVNEENPRRASAKVVKIQKKQRRGKVTKWAQFGHNLSF